MAGVPELHGQQVARVPRRPRGPTRFCPFARHYSTTVLARPSAPFPFPALNGCPGQAGRPPGPEGRSRAASEVRPPTPPPQPRSTRPCPLSRPHRCHHPSMVRKPALLRTASCFASAPRMPSLWAAQAQCYLGEPSEAEPWVAARELRHRPMSTSRLTVPNRPQSSRTNWAVGEAVTQQRKEGRPTPFATPAAIPGPAPPISGSGHATLAHVILEGVTYPPPPQLYQLLGCFARRTAAAARLARQGSWFTCHVRSLTFWSFPAFLSCLSPFKHSGNCQLAFGALGLIGAPGRGGGTCRSTPFRPRLLDRARRVRHTPPPPTSPQLATRTAGGARTRVRRAPRTRAAPERGASGAPRGSRRALRSNYGQGV